MSGSTADYTLSHTIST